jgi:hypothetical protein
VAGLFWLLIVGLGCAAIVPFLLAPYWRLAAILLLSLAAIPLALFLGFQTRKSLDNFFHPVRQNLGLESDTKDMNNP